MLTNSNPQSILVMLCLYKQWHQLLVCIKAIQRFISPGYNLFVSLFSGIHQICIPAFPFDPPMQSGTYNYKGHKIHKIAVFNPLYLYNYCLDNKIACLYNVKH